MKSNKMLGLFVIVLLLVLSCSGEDKAILVKYKTYMDTNASFDKASRDVLSGGAALMVTGKEQPTVLINGKWNELKSGDFIYIDKHSRKPDSYPATVIKSGTQYSAKIKFETFGHLLSFRKLVLKRQSVIRELAITGFARDLKISEKKMRKIAGKYKGQN